MYIAFVLDHTTVRRIREEHCTTTLASGADIEWVQQVHCKARKRSDPTTRQWPATTAALKRGACEPAPSDAGSVQSLQWWYTPA